MAKIYKVCDLFAGTGGFSLGLEQTGRFKTVYANDFEPSSKEIYDANFSIKLKCKDIHDIDVSKLPNFDVLTSGFPCFIAGTQVLTNSGYKNIEDVDIADKLLTHTGQFQNIVNLQRKNYNGNMYIIKIKNNSKEIICTEEHPFYVKEKLFENNLSMPLWIPANKLNKNHYFGMIKSFIDFDLNLFDNQSIIVDDKYVWFKLDNINKYITDLSL